MNMLVTGGAGYIGSHAVQRLLRDGHTVVAVDNLFRGHAEAMRLLEPQSGGRLIFHESDVGDSTRMERLMHEYQVDTVMHFAALAYVGESVDQPLLYYENNVIAGIRLLEACDRAGVGRFIFSSSCATYGEPSAEHIPINEDCPQSPVSPYGQTKLDFEHALRAWGQARSRAGEPVSIAMLRYFNVAGADRSGLLGEDHEPETHLIPVAINAALGKRDGMAIFGTDYPTPDGTCVRDYVHVEDLIDAHVRVMDRVKPGEVRAYNVGIGRGYSVREVLDAVRRVTGVSFEVREQGRRAGDPAALYNDPSRIERDLGWRASVTSLDEIVDSAWQWMKRNPGGYAGSRG
ncbi:MAG: UDP-glucose 4-epimerase GalE [Planctomycetota bacterium]|nr:MAG: UDP-glucose 4-epimerase GalE [Planctomycetota bacterium]